MSDRKFTDDEIIHSLKICINDSDCSECIINPHNGNYGYCTSLAIKAALDLINRQKAEIEWLNKEVDRLSQCVLYHDGIVSDLEKDVFNAKAEAIKEFAEIVKESFAASLITGREDFPCDYICESIDQIAEELTDKHDT